MQDKPSRSNLFSLHIDTETNSGWSREPKRECRNDPSPLASWLYWRRTSALSFWRSGPSNSSASMTRFQIITDFSKNTIQLQITIFFLDPVCRHWYRESANGDHRAQGPSLLCSCSVPPRIPVQTTQTISPISGFDSGRNWKTAVILGKGNHS